MMEAEEVSQAKGKSGAVEQSTTEGESPSTPSLVIVIRDSQNSPGSATTSPDVKKTPSMSLSPRTKFVQQTNVGSDGPMVTNQQSASSSKDDDLEITMVTNSTQDSEMSGTWEVEDSLQCAFCKEAFSDQCTYLMHLTSHQDMTCKEHLPLNKTKLCYFNNRYQCYNCRLKTKHRVVFREHVRHHVLKVPYKCSLCHTDMTSIAAFQQHIGSKSCNATVKDLMLKETDIVRQVMKMLGPKAPPTEHFYSVGKTPKTPDGETSNKPFTHNSPSRHESTSPIKISQDKSKPSGRSAISTLSSGTSVAQLMSSSSFKQTKSPGSFIKVTRPVLTVISESSTSVKQSGAIQSTMSLLSYKKVKKPEEAVEVDAVDQVANVESSKVEPGVFVPSDEVVTLQDPGQDSANTPEISDQEQGGKEQDEDTGVAKTTSSKPSEETSCPSEELQSKSESTQHGIDSGAVVEITPEVVTEQTTGVTSETTEEGESVEKQTVPEKSAVTTEIITHSPANPAENNRTTGTEDDSIRVIEVTPPVSSSESVASAQDTSTPVGQSADHPIVINDDDLHNATKDTQNKIKIEKRNNGIVLRLFRDSDGEMEDLSQLGLEIRGKSLFCRRCEMFFANMETFIPHVSNELHKIFFFHAGFCPVCKLKTETCPTEGSPCKLARILCRVLAVAFQTQKKQAVQGSLQQGGATFQPSEGFITIAPMTPAIPSVVSGVSPMEDSLVSEYGNTNQVQPAVQTVHMSPLARNTSNMSPISSLARTVAQVSPQPGSQILLVKDLGQATLSGASNRCAVLIPVKPAGSIQNSSTGQILTPVVLAPAPQAMISPGGVQPSMINSSVQPTMLCTGMQPTVINPGMQPKMINPGVQPTMISPGVQPKMINPGAQPTMINPGVQPTMISPGVQPTMISPGMQNKIINPGMQPTVINPNVQPTMINPGIQATVINTGVTPAIISSAVQHTATSINCSIQTSMSSLNFPSMLPTQTLQTVTPAVQACPSTRPTELSSQTILSTASNSQVHLLEQSQSEASSSSQNDDSAMGSGQTTENLIQSIQSLPDTLQPTTSEESIDSQPQNIDTDKEIDLRQTDSELTASQEDLGESPLTENSVAMDSDGKQRRESPRPKTPLPVDSISGLTFEDTIETLSASKTSSKPEIGALVESTEATVPDEQVSDNGKSDDVNSCEFVEPTEKSSFVAPCDSPSIISEILPNNTGECPELSDTGKGSKTLNPNVFPDVSNNSDSSSITSVDHILGTFSAPAPDNLEETGEFPDMLVASSSTREQADMPIPGVQEEDGDQDKSSKITMDIYEQEHDQEIQQTCSTETCSENNIDATNTAEAMTEVPKTNKTIGARVNGRGAISKCVKITPKTTQRKKPNRRIFVGKFVYKNFQYQCLSCNFKSKGANGFKIHLSKHVHFKRKNGSCHTCTHCPEHILFNRIGHCPVLKNILKVVKGASTLESALDDKTLSDPAVTVVTDGEFTELHENMPETSTNSTSDQQVESPPMNKSVFKSPNKPSTPSAASASPSPGRSSPSVPGSEISDEQSDPAAPSCSLEDASARMENDGLPTLTAAEPVMVPDDEDDDNAPLEANHEILTDESCRRIIPFQITRPWSKRAALEEIISNLDSVSSSTASDPKFLLKCVSQGCGYRTISEDTFKLHCLVKHASEPDLPCGYCSKLFPDIDTMIDHQDEHKGWVYKCTATDCGFGARKIIDYQNHMRENHRKDTSFKCCFCTKIADEVEDILSHTELHVWTQIKCPYCDLVSADKKVIHAHIAKYHKDQPRKMFVSTRIVHNLEDLEELRKQESEAASSAKDASNSESQETIQEMPDLISGAPSTEGQLQEATDSTQPGPSDLPMEASDNEEGGVEQPPAAQEYVGYKPTTCENCTFVATDEAMTDQHKLLHDKSQDKEKSFICRHCPFSSDVLLEFRTHLQHHTGKQTLRVYICANCEYSSMQMSQIEDHLSDVHPDEPFKFEVSQEKMEHMQLMSPCESCGEYVLNTTEEHMADHVELHHSLPAPVVEPTAPVGVLIERFHCDMCSYSAPSDEDLRLHLKITHRVDRTVPTTPVKKTGGISSSVRIINEVDSKKKQALYECDLCQYKTANKKIFIDHHRQHAEGATMGIYKCEFCPYESTKYKNLTHHQKIHARKVDEGFKCSYCYYVHNLKSRISWHISAYHPGKEKKIIEITKNNPVPPLNTMAESPAAPVPEMPKSKQAAVAKKTASSKVYKHSSQVSFEYQGPYATTSAAPAAQAESSASSPSKQKPVSALPQYLEDDSLRDFERNLPKDMIFKHPVFCPLCSYSNRVRVNMLRHLKTHVKPKQGETIGQEEELSAENPSLERSSIVQASMTPLPKDFLLFFKRSTEMTVFQCRLCSYVHVNGADMVRHFFCEHAVLGCSRCQQSAISLERMREHVSSVHNDEVLDVFLRRGTVIHKLEPSHLQKIDDMDKMTMLEEEKEEEAGTSEESTDFDAETAAVMKHCDKLMVGTQTRLKCRLCDYTTTLQLMKRHILSVHMRFMPFVCKYCKAACREKYVLQVHVKRMHPGRPIAMIRRKFDPEKHSKIVNTNICVKKRKRQSEGDDISGGTGYDGSESEHSQSMDRSSMERVTPSRDSVSSFDSVPQAHSSPLPTIKQEITDTPVQETSGSSGNSSRRRSGSDHSRLHDLRDPADTSVRSESAEWGDSDGTATEKNANQPKKKFCCAYCDYASLYLKQDIQRHILLKHLLIHVYMCKKCKFSTNNRKNIENHKRQNKNHNFRDWSEIKDKIVEIHKDGIEAVFGFPEGQLTEIQQELDKIPGLYQHVTSTPKKGSQNQSISAKDPSPRSHKSSDTDHNSTQLSTGLEDQTQPPSFTEITDPTTQPLSGLETAQALAQVKSQKKAAEIKLPRMELFCCAYCDYSSKYGRGDVKKHIMFKHFMNKKYTCEYCGFSTWTEQIIKNHMSTSHEGLPPNIYNNEFEHECIVPLRTTSDQHLIIGVKVPPSSPIEMQRNVLFQCKLCNVEGPNIIKIKLHVIAKHWNMKPFQCPVCDDQRWKRQSVLDHIKNEHPDCSDPPIATTTKKSVELANLVKKRVVFSSIRNGNASGSAPSTSKQHACCLCEFTTDSQQALEAHMTSHSIFACIYCPFQAMRKAEVQAHIMKDHPEFPVRIKTSMPSATPDSIQSIEEVESKKRKLSLVEFKQPPKKKMNFGQKFGMSSALKRKKPRRRLYQCKECGHQVENYKNMMEHICKHVNYFRFQCSYCSQQTLRAYHMTAHLEKKHPKLEPVYKIHKDEKLEEELKNSYVIIHKTGPAGKNQERPVNCPLCGKRCVRQSTLREHIMREMNYRPFLCPHCEYNDCTGGRVNFHMRIHKGVTGRYQVKIDSKLASKVQELIDEAKKNAEVGAGPKEPAVSPQKMGPLVVKFPKMLLKSNASPGPSSKSLSREPSITSISSSSVAGTSREPSIASISSTASEEVERKAAHSCHLCPYETNSPKLYKCHLMRTHGTKKWKCHYCDCKTVFRSTIIKHVRDTHRNLAMKIIQLLPTAKEPYKHEPDVQIVKAPTAYGKAQPHLTDLLPTSAIKTERRTPTKGVQSPKPPAKATPTESTNPAEIVGPDEEGLYHCSVCPYNTTMKKHIKMHLMCHKDADLECAYCLRNYRVIYRLRRHSRVRHPGSQIKWRNLVTGETFEAPCHPSGPAISMETNFEDSESLPQTYCCHMCMFSTDTANGLFRHVQEIHPVTDSSSVPSRPSSRQSTNSAISQADQTTLRCGFCSHTAPTQEDLDEHAKSHTICKPFRCAYCSYSCFQKIDGLRHCNRKHPEEEPSVLCQNTKPHVTGSGKTGSTVLSIKQATITIQDILAVSTAELDSLLQSQAIKRAHITKDKVLEVAPTEVVTTEVATTEAATTETATTEMATTETATNEVADDAASP